MGENQAKKEEETGKASEEKKEEPGKSSDFGAVGRKLKEFKEESEEISEESEKETEIKPDEKEKPFEEKEEKVEEEEEKPEATLFIIDKEGNKTPFIVKARGKYYTPDTPDKALTWGSMGIDSNERNEEIKKKEEELNQLEELLQALQKAEKEGKLYVEDEQGRKIKVSEIKEEVEKKEEEEEEDETLVDPEIKKLRKEVKELKKGLSEQKKLGIEKMIDETRSKMQGEISDQRKTHFALFDRDDKDAPKEIWQILAKNPKMTVDEAAKISHDSMLNYIKKKVEEKPDAIFDKKKIYADVLAEKEKKEEAPIESPSEVPAGSPGQEKEETGKKKTFREVVREGFKAIEEGHKEGQKS